MNMLQSNQIQWVVQQDFADPQTIEVLRNACQKTGTQYTEVDVFSFDFESPKPNIHPVHIYYGSGLLNYIPFLNSDRFTPEVYTNKWGSHVLDYSFSHTTFSEFLNAGYEGTKQFFIRPALSEAEGPADDNNLFEGGVRRFDRVADWFKSLKAQNPSVTDNTRITVSPYHILRNEWRLWIVKGKVVASSLYSEYSVVKKAKGCPLTVIQFAEKRCMEYMPDDVFVMDVCLSGDGYQIVDCASIHNADFFAADVDAIVKSISGYFQQHSSQWLLARAV
jgi:hypothetical protein